VYNRGPEKPFRRRLTTPPGRRPPLCSALLHPTSLWTAFVNHIPPAGSNSTLLHRIIKSESLKSGPGWVYGGDNKLDYDFRLVCANAYYGTDCDILCKPRNDQFGHYTCGPGGEKLCLDGWERRDATARDDYCMKRK
jgi:Golgi apparatus protein 1